MFKSFIEGTDTENYYHNHIGLSFKRMEYLFRFPENLNNFLTGDGGFGTNSLCWCDAIVKDDHFIKERYAGADFVNRVLDRYGITTKQYLALNNKERDKLLED